MRIRKPRRHSPSLIDWMRSVRIVPLDWTKRVHPRDISVFFRRKGNAPLMKPRHTLPVRKCLTHVGFLAQWLHANQNDLDSGLRMEPCVSPSQLFRLRRNRFCQSPSMKPCIQTLSIDPALLVRMRESFTYYCSLHPKFCIYQLRHAGSLRKPRRKCVINRRVASLESRFPKSHNHLSENILTRRTHHERKRPWLQDP